MLKQKRVTDAEANEIISSIPSLQTVFKKTKNVRLFNKRDAKSFVYFSRFNKNEASYTANQIGSIDEEKLADKNDTVSSNELLYSSAGKVNESADVLLNNFEKKRRYALSLATLAARPDKRISIVNDGAISILINLSSIHDKTIQVRAASAFASLSKESSIRAKMLDEGALISITLLANISHIKEVKMDCCRAICNLCCEKNYEYKMIKDGVPFTTTHIANSCPESYDICLKILLNLSCVSDKIARIEDVTEGLMLFFNNFLTYDQEVLLLATFCNLSSIRNNQLRLVEDGCFKIIEKFVLSKHVNLRMMACEILKNLSIDYRARSKLMDLNVIGILIEMSEDEVYEIKVSCAKTVLFLSKDGVFRNRLVEQNAIEFIIAQSQNFHSLEMSQTSAKTLRVLCSDVHIADKLVRDNIGAAMKYLASNVDDNVVRQNCSECICALFQNKELLVQLIEQCIVQVVLLLATFTIHSPTIEWTAFALYHLATSNRCPVSSMQQDILPCIIALCSDKLSSEKTKSSCCAALAHLSKLTTMNCTTSIPQLVDMLRNETNKSIKKYCASSLFNLADNDKNCFLMLDSECLTPIVQLTKSDHIQTKVICAGIISRLSLHKKYYYQFFAGNVLKNLLELSCVDHRLTQRRVVIALSNLSQNQDLRSKLLELNPIPYIISLAAERDEYLRRGCISIVCNMSFLPGSEKAIVQAGIIPTLLITSLITSDQIQSKIICVKALVNLMYDVSLYPIMVKEGVIWGLSKLADLDDEELLLLCAKALRNLSTNFAKEMIISSVAIKTLKKMLKENDLELKKIGAKILINLMLHTTDKEEVFRRNMVETLTYLVTDTNNNPELNETCIFCLCLASQSESCGPSIVSSGLLQKIDGTKIHMDYKVSYAYVMLLCNLANNPATRSKVLDNQTISIFNKICQTNDQSLSLIISNAVYCLSCSKENLQKLVDQNILLFIQYLIEKEIKDDSSRSNEMLSYIIPTMYNLTVQVDIQGKIVAQGFIDTLIHLWPKIEKDFKLCKLAFTSVCHLACGKTNSTRMVMDGCTSLLCFITEYKKNTALSHYIFSYDLYVRCSAAMRNLLSVVANQNIMVDNGCLDTILIMANKSYEALKDTETASSAWPANVVRVNCAEALKSLTFNEELRDTLATSEAINIILQEVISDGIDIPMAHGLLKELEAESWCNGARGKTKGGRVKNFKPDTLCCDYLNRLVSVQLNLKFEHDDLSKFCVQVQLDEPDTDNVLTADGSNTTTALDSDLLESYNIVSSTKKILITTEDIDELGVTQLQAYGKQECDLSFESITAISFSNTMQSTNGNNAYNSNNHDQDSIGSEHQNESNMAELANIINNMGIQEVEYKSNNTIILPHLNVPMNIDDNYGDSSLKSPHEAKTRKSSVNIVNTDQIKAISNMFPQLSTSQSMLISSKSKNQSVKLKKTKAEKEMEILVSMIKTAKNEKKPDSVDKVMNKWHSLSKH